MHDKVGRAYHTRHHDPIINAQRQFLHGASIEAESDGHNSQCEQSTAQRIYFSRGRRVGHDCDEFGVGSLGLVGKRARMRSYGK